MFFFFFSLEINIAQWGEHLLSMGEVVVLISSTVKKEMLFAFGCLNVLLVL